MVGFALVLSLALSSSFSQAGSQAGLRPSISHSPLLCTAPGRNPIVEASILPSSDIRTAKVYFRSDKYPKFYYIEMTPSKTGFHTALPKPSAETARIYYYIEAVDLSFNNMIGTEHIVEVSQRCAPPNLDPQPNIDPEIVVGASEAGLPALPPGFDTLGIVGTISAAGVSSVISGGSGISSAVVVGAVAASAGGRSNRSSRGPETRDAGVSEHAGRGSLATHEPFAAAHADTAHHADTGAHANAHANACPCPCTASNTRDATRATELPCHGLFQRIVPWKFVQHEAGRRLFFGTDPKLRLGHRRKRGSRRQNDRLGTNVQPNLSAMCGRDRLRHVGGRRWQWGSGRGDHGRSPPRRPAQRGRERGSRSRERSFAGPHPWRFSRRRDRERTSSFQARQFEPGRTSCARPARSEQHRSYSCRARGRRGDMGFRFFTCAALRAWKHSTPARPRTLRRRTADRFSIERCAG